jgi:DNA-binding NarL/FixJ family response regulator
VLIVDDHLLFAEAVASMLEAKGGFTVVGVAGSVAEARAMVEEHTPDVVTLDVELPDGDGIDFARELHANGVTSRVFMLTFRDDPLTASQAVQAHVAGFGAKDMSADKLIEGLTWAARGGKWIEPRVLNAVLEGLLAEPTPTPEQQKLALLTPREREVLECMALGLDRAASGRRLFLSTNTVRTHSRNLFAKLGVHSSLEAVAHLRRAGAMVGQDDISA